MKLLELTVRTLCGIRAWTVADAAYLYSQTKDNQESVLSAAAKLFRKGACHNKLFQQKSHLFFMAVFR